MGASSLTGMCQMAVDTHATRSWPRMDSPSVKESESAIESEGVDCRPGQDRMVSACRGGARVCG